MPYSGTGVFSRIHSWVTDKLGGVNIIASRMDAEMDGFATGLSNVITKDGQTTITAPIPFNNQRLTGLGTATADTDALSRGAGVAIFPRVNAAQAFTWDQKAQGRKNLGVSDPGARKGIAEVQRKLLNGSACTFAFFGDSITYGFDNTATGTGPPINGETATRTPTPFPETFASSLGGVFPGLVTVLNKGISGNTMGQILTRLTADVTVYDVTFVMAGINDSIGGAGVATTVEVYRVNLAKCIDLIISRASVPVVLLPTPVRGFQNTALVMSCAAAAKQVADSYGVLAVDTAVQLESCEDFDRWLLDGTHLSPQGNEELGWHLAGIFVPSGGDGRPKSVRSGSVLYPEDLFGEQLVYGPQGGSRRLGYVLSLTSVISQVAVYCEDDVIPVITTFNPTVGTTRTLECTYRSFALHPTRTLSFPHVGNATWIRKRWQAQKLKRGWRILTLSAPDATANLIEAIEFLPARGGGYLYAGQGELRKLSIAGMAFHADLSGVMGAYDYTVPMTRPFRLSTILRLPGNLGNAAGLSIAGDLVQATAEQSGNRIEIIRSGTDLLVRRFESGVMTGILTVAASFTAGVEFRGSMDFLVDATNGRVYQNGVLVATLTLPWQTLYAGLICYSTPSTFSCESASVRE